MQLLIDEGLFGAFDRFCLRGVCCLRAACVFCRADLSLIAR